MLTKQDKITNIVIEFESVSDDFDKIAEDVLKHIR